MFRGIRFPATSVQLTCDQSHDYYFMGEGLWNGGGGGGGGGGSRPVSAPEVLCLPPLQTIIIISKILSWPMTFKFETAKCSFLGLSDMRDGN